MYICVCMFILQGASTYMMIIIISIADVMYCVIAPNVCQIEYCYVVVFIKEFERPQTG